MSEETKLKQDLLNLANNLDSAEGVILLKGINSEEMKVSDVLYHQVNPLFAISPLLAAVTDLYEKALSDLEFGLSKGEFSEKDIKEVLAEIRVMIDKFGLITLDLDEESKERRNLIISRGIGSKEVEKEEN